MLIVVEATHLCGHIKPSLTKDHPRGHYVNLAEVETRGAAAGNLAGAAPGGAVNPPAAAAVVPDCDVIGGGYQVDGSPPTVQGPYSGQHLIKFLPFFATKNTMLNMKCIDTSGDLNKDNDKDLGLAFTDLCDDESVGESMRPYNSMKEAAYVAFVRSVCDDKDYAIVDVYDDEVEVKYHPAHKMCLAVRDGKHAADNLEGLFGRVGGAPGHWRAQLFPYTAGGAVARVVGPAAQVPNDEKFWKDAEKLYSAIRSREFSAESVKALTAFVVDPAGPNQVAPVNSGFTDLSLMFKDQLQSRGIGHRAADTEKKMNFKYHVLLIQNPPSGINYTQATDGTGMALIEPKPKISGGDIIPHFKTYHEENDNDFWNRGLAIMQIVLPGYQKSPSSWNSAMSKYTLTWPHLKKLGKTRKWLMCIIPSSGKFYKIDRSFQGGNDKHPLYRGEKLIRVSKQMMDDAAALSDGITTGRVVHQRLCLPPSVKPSKPWLSGDLVQKAVECWNNTKPAGGRKDQKSFEGAMRTYKVNPGMLKSLQHYNDNSSKDVKHMVLVSSRFGDAVDVTGTDLPGDYQVNRYGVQQGAGANAGLVYCITKQFLDSVEKFNLRRA